MNTDTPDRTGTRSDNEPENGAITLDLSSLSSLRSEEKNKETVQNASDKLTYDTVVQMLDSNEIGIEEGLTLLKKEADNGCIRSRLHLGQLYGDESSEFYNPALAFECFETAAEQNSGKGYYMLGLCFHVGLGCEKDENRSLDCFLKGAELGNSDCICSLGICREFGIGCPVNYEIAVGLYQQAADLGNVTAINNLGGCYYYGHGVPQDKERAIELYEKAAELGNAGAKCRLGICKETGDGCERDRAAAFEYYQSAAESNNAVALYHLALAYDKGIGTEQNFANAYKCYEKSALAGYAPAMYEAGMMNKNGRGTKKDLSLAYKMFSAAATFGNPDAEYEVGNCLLNGLGTVRNHENAYTHYLMASMNDPNNPKAAFKLGLCKLKGIGTEANEKEAFEWFSKGAELGSKGAMYMKGECLFYGVGTEEDKSSAVTCFTQAASYEYEDIDRVIPSILALAECYKKGLGVEQNHDAALELYRKATEYGDSDAWFLMGQAILSGVGIKAEYGSARNCFLRAARKEHIPSMKMLGWFADEGKGIAVNKKDACKWYTLAINKKLDASPSLFDFPNRYREKVEYEMQMKLEAQYRLGILLPRHNGTVNDYTQGFEYVALAASLNYMPAQTEITKIYVHGGDLKSYYESPLSDTNAPFENGSHTPDKATLSEAMNRLGDAMFNGSGVVRKNLIAAARCYKIAAELGNVESAYSYGWCLRHGQGVRENNVEAVKWLKLAADKGNVNAAFSYGLCCEEGSGVDIKNRREALSYYRKAAASGHAEAMQRYIKLSEQDD